MSLKIDHYTSIDRVKDLKKLSYQMNMMSIQRKTPIITDKLCLSKNNHCNSLNNNKSLKL